MTWRKRSLRCWANSAWNTARLICGLHLRASMSFWRSTLPGSFYTWKEPPKSPYQPPWLSILPAEISIGKVDRIRGWEDVPEGSTLDVLLLPILPEKSIAY